jgi:hypothetical protein
MKKRSNPWVLLALFGERRNETTKNLFSLRIASDKTYMKEKVLFFLQSVLQQSSKVSESTTESTKV